MCMYACINTMRLLSARMLVQGSINTRLLTAFATVTIVSVLSFSVYTFWIGQQSDDASLRNALPGYKLELIGSNKTLSTPHDTNEPRSYFEQGNAGSGLGSWGGSGSGIGSAQLVSPLRDHGPRKLLLVCLFTGGTEHSTNDEIKVNARVDAQLHAWADDVDVYYVTHMNISTHRRIWLPDEAESGGYYGIWKKTLHTFHHLAHTEFGQQYDFVFKGDDDTLLNLPQLRKLLRRFDETVPFQLGNDRFEHVLRKTAPTSPFYRQKRGTTPCHGGAGYVLSRGAVELVGPHFLDCMKEWPMSELEDVKMSYCLNRYAAITCIGMHLDFGWEGTNLDRSKVASKIKALDATPMVFARGVSFHPVPEQFQSVIHDRLTNLTAELGDEIDSLTREELREPHRYLVGQWNCSKSAVEGRGGNALGDGKMNALCQKHILKHAPFRNAVRPVTCSKVADDATCILDNGLTAFDMDVDAVDAVVLVALSEQLNPGQGQARRRGLELLISTLRSSGSNATVVLFADDAHTTLAETVQAASSSTTTANVVVVPVSTVASNPLFLHGYALLALRIYEFLQAHRGRFRVAALSSPNVVFQQNPFETIPYDDGLAVFITDTFPSNLTLHKTPASLAMQWMGVCNARDARAVRSASVGSNSFRGPGTLDMSFVIGKATSLKIAMSELVHSYGSVSMDHRNICQPYQLFSRLVWFRILAERIDLTIPLQSNSPVINIGANDTRLWSIADGVVKNQQGHIASVVVFPEQCPCCDTEFATENGYSRTTLMTKQICPQVVLATFAGGAKKSII